MDHQLLSDVYECDICPREWFIRDEDADKNHRFPPTIGATSKVRVLFVGINPAMRAGSSLSARKNQIVHRRSIRSLEAFALLARNRKSDSEGRNDGPYIRRHGDEPFYNIHLDVLSAAGLILEEDAAITEMFLCASANSKAFYKQVPTSRCACLFLDRTISSCDPEVLIPLGPQVDQHFRPPDAVSLVYQIERMGRLRWVMPIPHPGQRGLTGDVRGAVANGTGQWIRDILGGRDPDNVPALRNNLKTSWLEMAEQSW